MKKNLAYIIVATTLIFASCQKKNISAPSSNQEQGHNDEGKYGPLGKFTKWKSISGDSIFSADLTLSWYFVQNDSPCNIHFYAMNYPLWNCYDQDFLISECVSVKDTLIIKDKDTNKKALFIKLN